MVAFKPDSVSILIVSADTRRRVFAGVLASLCRPVCEIEKNGGGTFSDRLANSILSHRFLPETVGRDMGDEAEIDVDRVYCCCGHCGAPVTNSGCVRCRMHSLDPARYVGMLVVPKCIEREVKKFHSTYFLIDPESARQSQRNVLVTQDRHTSDRTFLR